MTTSFQKAALFLVASILPAILIADDAAPPAPFVSISPDKTIRLEELSKDMPDGGVLFTYKISDPSNQHVSILNSADTEDLAAYPAGFRFSPNSQWLVRMQKIAAGESTLFLYKRNGFTFVPATDKKSLGDLAWDYYFSLPDSHSIDRNNLSPETILVKGMDDNYASLGEHWPDSRYIVIDLLSGESGTAVLGPWRCLYDTTTASFSVPPDFAAFNKQAGKTAK
jgi:hypothetical protein